MEGEALPKPPISRAEAVIRNARLYLGREGRQVILFPNPHLSGVDFFGTNPKAVLEEKVKSLSDFEIAKEVSTSTRQMTTFAVWYLRQRLHVKNENLSPRPKLRSKNVQIIVDAEKKDILKILNPQESVVMTLRYLLSGRNTTLNEVARVLGISRNEAFLLEKETLKKLKDKLDIDKEQG